MVGIWAERQVFEEPFIQELTAALALGNAGGGTDGAGGEKATGAGDAGGKAEEVVDSFQVGRKDKVFITVCTCYSNLPLNKIVLLFFSSPASCARS